MLGRLKKYGLTLLALALVVFVFADEARRQTVFNAPEKAQAAAITSATWVLSSSTENATDVTYTHTFTITQALQAGDEVRVVVQRPPGPPQPLPFLKSTTASSTVGLRSRTVTNFPYGDWMRYSFTADAAVAAGAITVVYTADNPVSGGIFPTNTSTLRNNTALDGNPDNPDANGSITIGTVKLSGNIKTDNNCDGDSTDTGEGGLQGLRLEIHPGPNSPAGTNGFWSTTTDSSGNYSFAGLSNGAFVLEKSPGVDPNSSKAATVSQYAGFDPVNVTISDTPQTVNKLVCKSQKSITGKVVYKGTTTPVRNAMVNAGSMGGGFANTQSGSDGSFTLTMAANGQVFFMIQPNAFGGFTGPGGGTPPPTDSDFGSVQRQLAFVLPTATAEVINLGNVEVEKATATLSYCIKNPNGSAYSGFSGIMDFERHNFTPAQLDASGCASVKLIPGGTVKIDAPDFNGDTSMPNTKVKIKKGTNNVGNIVRVTNSETITVQVNRTDGGTTRGIANAQAMVFPSEPGPPVMATTDSTGKGIVRVQAGFKGRAGAFPGGSFGGGPKGPGGGGGPSAFMQLFLGLESASAQAAPTQSDDGDLYPLDGFKPVEAKAGKNTATVRFGKADASFSVKTTKSDGTLVTDGGFVDIDMGGVHIGCPTAGGIGTCKGISGASAKGRVMFPPDRDVLGKTTAFTVTAGATVNLQVLAKNRTISGFIKKADGTVIKDAALAIDTGAFSSDGFSFGRYNPSTGSYSIPVSAGKWRVGAMAQGDSRFVPTINPVEIDTTEGNATKDIELGEKNGTVTGTVKDSSGNTVENVTLVFDEGMSDLVKETGVAGPGPGGPGGPEEGRNFVEQTTTDEKGQYTIALVPGRKYTVIADGSQFNPPLYATQVYQVEPVANGTKTLDMSLVKADMTLKIDANIEDGKASAYSENGMVGLFLKVNEEGKVEMQVPSKDSSGAPMTYFVKAGDDQEGKTMESPETKIIGEENKTVDINLTAVEDISFPKSASVEVSSSSAAAAAITDTDGTQKALVSIPSGVLGSDSSSGSSESSSSSSGSSIVDVAMLKGELPGTKAFAPVGEGIEITATDSSGNSITSLSGVAPIETHIDKEDLPSGVNPAVLKLAYYNESTKQYEDIQSSDIYAIDKDGAVLSSLTDSKVDEYVVSGTTNHFSTFAVVASTDTTAPGTPTDIKATDKGTDGAVTVSWTKPTDTDFASVSIYRSTASGTLGAAIKTGSTDTTYADTGLTNGTKYYYTVRAVDTSANESTNTTQYYATPTKAETLPKTGLVASSSPLPGLIGLSFVSLVLAGVWLSRKHGKA